MLSDFNRFFDIKWSADSHPHVWSRCFNMTLYNLRKDDFEVDSLIKGFYCFLKSKLKVEMLNSVHYYFGFESEHKFIHYKFEKDYSGSISFDFEIKYLWFDNINNEFYEIIIPAGLGVFINIYTNGNMDFYLDFRGNVFTNILWGVDPETNEGYEYYFRPAAIYNRAMVRNLAFEMEMKYGGTLEAYPEKELFTRYDKYGPTDESLLTWLDPDYKS